ncbi:MAG: hypothetical protein ACYTF3_01510 [Planctomycetota bacterium]|jgi:CheY-like chemotaxis protein
MSLIRTMAHRLTTIVAGAALFVSLASPVHAQQELLDEGMKAYRQGNYEAALENFRAIVAADPTSADAMSMLQSSEDALLELLVAGGEFETFAREILVAAREGGVEAMRDMAAAAAAAEGCFSDDFRTRQEAIFALGQQYGPYGAAPLVSALGDADEDRRLKAIYALSRMGGAVFVPVFTATWSSNTEVRLGALHVLNALGDGRADARIADLAANDGDGSVRALASNILDGFLPDPAYAMAEQGMAYFNHDTERGLSPAENYGVLWNIEGRQLTPYDVPAALVELELAKYHQLRASELGADVESALALTYATEVAILGGMGEDLADQMAAQRNAMLTLSRGSLNSALESAVAGGDGATAAVLVKALDGPGCQDWSGLRAALSSGMPAARHAAAIALGYFPGAYDSEVVAALGEAVALEARRVVHIVDGESARANALASDLRAMGVDVMIAEDGAHGLVNMHLAADVDAFVVANPLPDLYASRFLKMVRQDERFGSTPVFVVGSGDLGDVDAEVVDLASADAVMGAFQDLEGARAEYLAVASRAANVLGYACWNGAGAPAMDGLMSAIDREDEVAIPALMCLGFIGDASAAAGMAAVVGDTGRSSEARTAAADGLAELFARSGATMDAAVFQSAMTEGDAALAEACARAIGVMGGGHLSAGVSVQ